jgi:hypothetical protein
LYKKTALQKRSSEREGARNKERERERGNETRRERVRKRNEKGRWIERERKENK